MTTATAKKAQDDAQAQKDYAAEKQAAIAEADAEFQKAVEEAAAARQEVLDQYPDESNIAERAWNQTKSDEDPLYKDTTATHRHRLTTAVDSIRTTGTAGIEGLQEFEARAIELLAEAGTPAGSGPAYTPQALLDEGEDAETATKSGQLPADFPHREALRDHGINTYNQARALNGDYTEVAGIGTAKGKEIDAAL